MKKFFILMVSAAMLSGTAFAAGAPSESMGAPQFNREAQQHNMQPQNNQQRPDKLSNGAVNSSIYKDSGKYGLKNIDNGKVLLKPSYEKMGAMGDNHFKIKNDGKWGIVDKSGKVIVSPMYDKVEMYDGKYFKVRKNGKWGVVDSLGRVLIGVSYTASELTELIKRL